MMDETESTPDNCAKLLRRLERLVPVLIGKRFGSAADLWHLQTSLLDLQQDVQDEIRSMRVRSASEVDRDCLDELRRIRWHARHFGDAIAWLLLGLDRRLIYPLGDNDPVPIAERGHGTQGAVAIATALSDNLELGFPILHDITDCLRIGDVTFVQTTDEPLTVELKTRFVQEREDGESRVVEYQATVLADGTDVNRLPPAQEKKRAATEPPRFRYTERVRRQMSRLSKAKMRQTMPFETPVEVDGKSTIAISAPEPPGSNWEQLRSVTRRARRTGYGSAPVDGCFLYAAFYDPEGLDVDRLGDSFRTLSADLVESGVLGGAGRDQDALLVASVPSPDARGPGRYMPYFLHPLPQATIVDILWGRMAIFNLVNTGALATRIEEAGVQVSHASSDWSNFVLERRTADREGETMSAQVHNLHTHFDEMVMEFRSAEYLTTFAEATFDALRRVAS